MAEAARAFDDFLAPFYFAAPNIPVIANVTARPYPVDSTSESVKSLLVKQITHSVCWDQSVRFLIDKGVTEFTEIGPGNVLTKMMQQIQKQKAA
jgi:malonyl CoA-acyl carrier protein transacylase